MRTIGTDEKELLEEIHQLSLALKSHPAIEEHTDEHNKSIELFARAMCVSNDALWDWNLKTDEVYCSPGLKSLFGYRDDELEDKVGKWLGLIHPEDKQGALRETRDFLAGRTNKLELELRMRHKSGAEVFIRSRAFLVDPDTDGKPTHLAGIHIDITAEKKQELFETNSTQILKMIAMGYLASEIYDAIALMYEGRHAGMKCSMLELHDNKLLHGGAPSLPKEYCDAVNGLEYGPDVGSCGTSTYTGKRVLVEDIETDPKWINLKKFALPHGLKSCWSEPIKNSMGQVLGAFGMYHNHPQLPNEQESDDLKSAARLAGIVMERDQAYKRIRELAYTDELTGLGSRAHFYQNLEILIKKCKHLKTRFWLLYIDVDEFKVVNDSLGHDVGDRLLKEIARRLASVSRNVDFVARLSGDEFCILIQDNDEYAEAELAQRYLKAVSWPIELSARKLTLTSSIGIAHYPRDAEDLSTLMKAADTSLYAAKENGKNQYVFYAPELARKEESRFQFEQYLRDAVEKQQLSVVYQPQIDIHSGEIIGLEALSRWNHHILGDVPPSEFIAAAERIGVINQLAESVLSIACRQAVALKNSGFRPVRMGINISPSHFIDTDIVSLISGVVSETGMVPSELELEITESLVQTDRRNLSIFQGLKGLGVQLSIDDFGTGYSSFASLKHLRADRLKIDKYFVDDMLTDEQTQLLMRSMIEMGHNLGQEIVAEGVETAEQVDLLKNLGCDVLQGNLFSPPVDANELSKLLGKKYLPL